MTVGLPLMKTELTPLAKSILVPLRLKMAAQQEMELFKRIILDWVL